MATLFQEWTAATDLPHGAAFLLNHIMNCSGNEVIAKKVKILPATGKLKEETYTHVANRLIYMHL